MKKLSILILSCFALNVLAEEQNNTFMLRIDPKAPLKIDEIGQWILDHYTYDNIQNPTIKSESVYFPLIENQENMFNQTKTQEIGIVKTRTSILVNNQTGEFKTGNIEEIEEIENISIERTVVPQLQTWSNIGGLNCFNWSPSTEDYLEGLTFTQNRTCEQLKQRTINYFVNSVQIDSKVQNELERIEENRIATGTKIPENLSPASAGDKINLLNSTDTGWDDPAVFTNNTMFNGYANIYGTNECMHLDGTYNVQTQNQTHYVDFTVDEPLMLTVTGNTSHPLYSNGSRLYLTEKNKFIRLSELFLNSNGIAVKFNYLLQPGIIYSLKSDSNTVFCELGAIK